MAGSSKDIKTDPRVYTKNILVSSRYDIGDFTYGSPKLYDWEDGSRLIIGKYTSIADDTVILLGGNHRTDWVSTYPFPAFADVWPNAKKIEGYRVSKGDIVIGNDVWVGNGATILSGVTIGDGAVIAARSVVTKSIPPYAIVAGAPAKIVKYRFSRLNILHLLRIAWWNWPTQDIEENMNIICSNNLELLKKKYALENNLNYKKYILKIKVISVFHSLGILVPKRKRFLRPK